MSTFETLPSELKDKIFSHMSQETLHCSLFISPTLREAAARQLYRSPYFLTTYRFAQFVTTVSHCRDYADMVRIFRMDDECKIPGDFATWRHWRTAELGPLATRPAPGWAEAPAMKTYGGLHPLRTDYNSKSMFSVPVGAIIHVIAACQNIRRLDLQCDYLEDDLLIKSAAHPPTAASGLIFVSDGPRSFLSPRADTKLINTHEIVEQLTKLAYLEDLTIKTLQWLPISSIKKILSKCPGLKKIDLSGVDTGLVKTNNSWSSLKDKKRWYFEGDDGRLWEWFNSRKDVGWELSEEDDKSYHYYS
ncbi:hypothetical protein N7G274_009634 [Stereocaulon virgatum]|uniref:F-box domain-containing protein n=1 Tax=Stereocaulon virgatum TaxID=373712 RepID=A0ABR3ZWZ9_9LECA